MVALETRTHGKSCPRMSERSTHVSWYKLWRCKEKGYCYTDTYYGHTFVYILPSLKPGRIRDDVCGGMHFGIFTAIAFDATSKLQAPGWRKSLRQVELDRVEEHCRGCLVLGPWTDVTVHVDAIQQVPFQTPTRIFARTLPETVNCRYNLPPLANIESTIIMFIENQVDQASIFLL